MQFRLDLRDVTILVGTTIAAGLVAFEYDFVGDLPETKRVRFHEMVVIGALLVFGVLFLGWRHMNAQEQEIARRIAAEQRVLAIAYTDPLSGLANRRGFEEALIVAVSGPNRSAARFALLMLDLNGFKAINDRHGHPVGDKVLAVVAARFSAVMREGDHLARVGGDEFAVIARLSDGPEDARQVALRMVRSLVDPIEIEGNLHRVGVEIGMTLISTTNVDPAEVVRQADAALYEAKATKRSIPRFYDAKEPVGTFEVIQRAV